MFRFRPPIPDDAALLLEWRKRPDVTRWMFTDIDHGVEAQRGWIERSAARADLRHFVIEASGDGHRPVGYLAFAQIDGTSRHCSTGHYFADAEDRRRFGGYMHAFILDYAFYRLGMNKVVNSFMAGNSKVLKLQSILRYRPVGVYREHVFKYGAWHDVHVFEMMEREWATHPHPFPRDATLGAYMDCPEDQPGSIRLPAMWRTPSASLV
ncbi:GNAT family N-acetyltransferase [Azospirillum agricola]|uniref:GNAT family N-acetyltransferase n=1 Tax=Azospirillum agricola TaxID=1720247 RepID=UPI000A0F2882|nr:GNAT family N-acetyltransferase [Azospirillum agricola]SMH41640.1 Protein N-acetyltransferase, RimJ/RimL family [Azospirillum lipoferum]